MKIDNQEKWLRACSFASFSQMFFRRTWCPLLILKTSKVKVSFVGVPPRQFPFLALHSPLFHWDSCPRNCHLLIFLHVAIFWSLCGYFSYFDTNQSSYIRSRSLLCSQQRALDTAQVQFRMLKNNWIGIQLVTIINGD